MLRFIIMIFLIILLSCTNSDQNCPDKPPWKDKKDLVLLITDKWHFIGNKEGNYAKEVIGTEKRIGYQRDNSQIILEFFEKEDLPYKFWFHNIQTKKSSGMRIDGNRDGIFEYSIPDCRKHLSVDEIPEFRKSWKIE